MSHTPGPWEADDSSGYGHLNGRRVVDPRGYVLAVAIGDVPELAPEANSRLIAAAPDLLEALWVATEHNALHFGERHNTVIQGRAALARATGDQP